jgi:hypothetical protein
MQSKLTLAHWNKYVDLYFYFKWNMALEKSAAPCLCVTVDLLNTSSRKYGFSALCRFL